MLFHISFVLNLMDLVNALTEPFGIKIFDNPFQDFGSPHGTVRTGHEIIKINHITFLRHMNTSFLCLSLKYCHKQLGHQKTNDPAAREGEHPGQNHILNDSHING